ncbi:progranulin isoform X6 [Pleurodeles waltl]|uniref:progranulin isoform X6 n=1 Tax=Pleurodeles waltl TaxID=8319 RepID=UPI0037097CB5
MQKAAPVRKPYFLFHSDSVVTCLANHVTRTVLLSRRSPSSEVSFKESSRLQEPLLSHREQVMWSSLVLWLSLASLGTAVICPDGQSCEAGTRCCHLPGGGYGCCPLSPDVLDALPMVQPGSLKDFSGKFCPNKATCPLEYSCITTPVGLYGCCPWEEAVSCDDGRHCCPQDFLCSADGRSCLRRPVFGLVNAIVCPDGESECPNESTCCEMPDHSWGCCPMPQATCCEDKVHCCPHSSTCDVAHGSCNSPDGEKPMWTKFAARKRASWEDELWENNPENNTPARVLCGDGSSCPDGTTCCKISDKKYGCCPIVDAVCCDDSEHCCPPETECDLSHNKCISETGSSPMLIKTLAQEPHFAKAWPQKEIVRDVKCDDTASCQDGQTCCRLASGEWGCCPLAKAVCCSDHIHCCPSGTTCDTEHEACNTNSESFPWVKKVRAKETSQNIDVQCDSTTYCNQGETCCRTASERWACCPLSQAVCCSDHIHCCPSGTTCDTEHETCSTNNVSIPWVSKVRAKVPSQSSDVQCNATTHCSDGETCCKTPSGSWACCPLPQAVCCSDHMHCCPSGYTCNVEQETCLQGSWSVPWQTKIPIRMVELKYPSLSLKCDDKVFCEENETCCKTPGGEWACCPLPQALCCSDHIHCCPNGYTCNLDEGTCVGGEDMVALFSKTPAYVKNIPGRSDIACDDTFSCPDDNTCCRTASGEWGCCPMPKAVCCSDHVHCCPNGYTCNVEQESCVQGGLSVPWFRKDAANVDGPPHSRLVPCDDTASCPDGNTCCKSESGTWACCPLAGAVCCSDHVHCCPHGYTCDVEQGSCIQGNNSIPFLTKIRAHIKEMPHSSIVPCDETFSCPNGNTCCRTASGEWGCCPTEKAVCCSDHVHCCPNGYTCNVEQQSCTRGDEEIPFLLKTQTHVKKVPHIWEVPCDDTSSCPADSTCCRSVSGSWDCCPVEKAVCCDDHEHCCPSGYTCDTTQGSCTKGDRSISWLTKRIAPNREVLRSEAVPCDDSHVCAEDSTCCRTTVGTWSCCHLPQAVCCSDHVHCCPYGYTCNVADGTCTEGNKSVRWHSKSVASLKEEAVVACDESTSCPKDSTCCRSDLNEWACCPLLEAVCCVDGRHCCPYGYKCVGDSCEQEKALRWDNKSSRNREMNIL